MGASCFTSKSNSNKETTPNITCYKGSQSTEQYGSNNKNPDYEMCGVHDLQEEQQKYNQYKIYETLQQQEWNSESRQIQKQKTLEKEPLQVRSQQQQDFQNKQSQKFEMNNNGCKEKEMRGEYEIFENQNEIINKYDLKKIVIINEEQEDQVKESQGLLRQREENKRYNQLIEDIKKRNSNLESFLNNINSGIQNTKIILKLMKEDSTILPKSNLDDYLRTFQQIPTDFIYKYDERNDIRQDQCKDILDITQEINLLQSEYISSQLARKKTELQLKSSSAILLRNCLEKDENDFNKKQNELLINFKVYLIKKIVKIDEFINELSSEKNLNSLPQNELKEAQTKQIELQSIEQELEFEILNINENIKQDTLLLQMVENEILLINQNIKSNSDLILKNQTEQQNTKRDFFTKLQNQKILIDKQINAIKLEQFKMNRIVLVERREDVQSKIKDIHFIYVIDGSGSMKKEFQICLDAITKCLIDIPSQFSKTTQKTLHTILQFSDKCLSMQPYGLKGNEIDISLIQQMKDNTDYNSAFKEIQNVIEQQQSSDLQYIVLFFTDGKPDHGYDPSNLINLKSQLQSRFHFFGIAFQKVDLLDRLVQQINQNEIMNLGNGQIIPSFFQIEQLSQIIQSFTNVSLKVHKKRMQLQEEKEQLERDIRESDRKIKQEEEDLQRLIIKQNEIIRMIQDQNASLEKNEIDLVQITYFKSQIELDEKKIPKKKEEILELQKKLLPQKKYLKEKQDLFSKNAKELKQTANIIKSYEQQINQDICKQIKNPQLLLTLQALSKNFQELQKNLVDYGILIKTQIKYVNKVCTYVKEVADTTEKVLNKITEKNRKEQFVVALKAKSVEMQNNIFEEIIKSKNVKFYQQIKELPDHQKYFNFLFNQQDRIFYAFQMEDDISKKLEYILTKKDISDKYDSNINGEDKEQFFKKIIEILEHLLCVMDLHSKLFDSHLIKAFIGVNALQQNIIQNHIKNYYEIPRLTDCQEIKMIQN